MSLYQYRPDLDVHVLDCGGLVDLPLGLERLAVLRRELQAHPTPDGICKLLIDLRNTVWASEEVHLQLAEITRREFSLEPSNTAIRAAFVHPAGHGCVSANEHWFSEVADALEWLTHEARGPRSSTDGGSRG